MLEMLGPRKIDQGRGLKRKFVEILGLVVSRGREDAKKKKCRDI